MLISASAPGTTGAAAPQPTYPAVYSATFNPATLVATVKPLFYDEAAATVANVGKSHGKTVNLALTDPDSNEDVPWSGPRFAGDFMLTSQGDKEQIFYAPGGKLKVLRLSQSVDDTAWARSWRGLLVGASTATDTIDVVTGPFQAEVDLCRGHPVRRGQRPGHLPRAGLPAELPRPAQPVDGPDHQGGPVRPVLRPAGHGLHRPRLERGAGLAPCAAAAPLAINGVAVLAWGAAAAGALRQRIASHQSKSSNSTATGLRSSAVPPPVLPSEHGTAREALNIAAPGPGAGSRRCCPGRGDHLQRLAGADRSAPPEARGGTSGHRGVGTGERSADAR